MNKFELIFDIVIAFIMYGVIGLVAAFFGLLFLADLEFDTMLTVTAVIAVILGCVGAAVPMLRKAAVFILSLFAPSAW